MGCSRRKKRGVVKVKSYWRWLPFRRGKGYDPLPDPWRKVRAHTRRRRK